MRLARVIGTVTINRKLPGMKAGTYLVADVLDAAAMDGGSAKGKRAAAMPESLVVFDELGAGVGQIIAVSEGREASMQFHPERMPIDAYCAAIIDKLQWEEQKQDLPEEEV